MLRGRLRIALALASALALSHCDSLNDAPGAAGPNARQTGTPVAFDTLPRVETVTVDSSRGPLFRTLRVLLDRAAGIQVDYWASGAPHLRVTTPVDTSGKRYVTDSVFLPRLRASTAYTYEVRTVEPDGALGAPDSGTVTTGALPSGLAGYQFSVQGTPSFPLAMLELWGASFNGWVIIDATGQVVWYAPACNALGSTRRANGNFVLLDTCAGLREVTPDGRLVDSLPAGPYQMNHDVVATPQNTLLFIAEESRVLNDTSWTGNAIWEWNPETGSVVKRWSTFDVLSPAVDRGPASSPGDWLHANSLAIGPRGNVVVSFLYTGQVISLSPDFTTVEWRLGGPNSTIAVDSGAQTYGQHTAAEVGPDTVLVFDNMTYDSTAAGHYSRGLEIALDPVAHTAHKVWEFRPGPDIWAPYVGSDRPLPNGDRLVSFGLSAGTADGSGPIAAYEVSASSAVVWHLEVSGPLWNYRTTPLSSVGGEVEVPAH